MKLYFSTVFIFISIIISAQSYKNLNKYKGFKEIWIGENINKYRANIIKINKSDEKYYNAIPDTENDIYFYESPTTNTIFGHEIAFVYLVADYYNKIIQISVIPKNPDNKKQILNFYKSEFGKPYETVTEDKEQNPMYLWAGNDIALRVIYITNNNNFFAIIDYLKSYESVQKDK